MTHPNLNALDAFERLYATYVRNRLIKQQTSERMKLLDSEALRHTKELREEVEKRSVLGGLTRTDRPRG